MNNNEKIIDDIIDYMINNKKKFLFISGNGGSGKTELSKKIAEKASKIGKVNTIDMDDFVVDTQLRKNSKVSWVDADGNEQLGRCSTSFISAYFLQNVYAIMANIENGNDYYHWPKKGKSFEDCRLLKSDAVFTIVEGIGTVFLDKNPNNSLSIFMTCSEDVEIKRRLQRKRFSNEQNIDDIKRDYVVRNSQFICNILPHLDEHELYFESKEDYSLVVKVDKLCIIKNINS